jgi:hypothetical protein
MSDCQALERYAQLGDSFQLDSLLSRDDGTSPRVSHWIPLGGAYDPGSAATVDSEQGCLSPLQHEWMRQVRPPHFNLAAQLAQLWVDSHLWGLRWGKEF